MILLSWKSYDGFHEYKQYIDKIKKIIGTF